MDKPRVCQVAFNHLGGARLWEWYRDGFGFLPSGSTLFLGPPASKVNGLPRPVFPGHWLLDGKELFQLEFFRFLSPTPTPRRPDEKPNDIGYRMVGIHTVEFEATLSRLEQAGSSPAGPILGEPGDRRVCFRDPEGNWIELVERDPLAGIAPPKERPDIPATVRWVTVSVPDLDAARESWVEKAGLPPSNVESIHDAGHEALWGLEGARRKTLLLDGGGTLVELVEYERPRGRPRPEGYRICDQGLMNIALLAPNQEAFDRTFAAWVEAGLTPRSPTPLKVGVFSVMYFDLPSGENVELLFPRRWAWSITGFLPSGGYIGEEVFVKAPVEAVWDRVSDHARLGEWSVFPSTLVEPGRTEPNGLGALRRVRDSGMSFDERVFHWDPPRRYGYRIERGPLIRHHRGDLVLTPEADGTRVRWAIRIGFKVPGSSLPVSAAMGRKVRKSLQRLKADLESA